MSTTNERGKATGVPTSASEVLDHPVVEAGARAGYAVNGLLHLLIGVLGLQVAFGHRGAEADTSGAMRLVAGSPVGGVVLVAIVVGFALLAVWQAAEGVRAHEASDKAKAFSKAVVYVALGWGAVTLMTGTSKSGSSQATDATASLLGLPFGPVLVGAGGLAVIGVGAYHVRKGWTEGFRKDLESSPSRPEVIAGRLGYIAKGIALGVVGVGLIAAAALHDPSQSKGLDGALSDLVALPFGQVLVALISLGFAAYGFYSFSRARRARV